MTSPFPGMDPFLEGSEWTSIHTVLSIEIARQLVPMLRPKYIARSRQRFVSDIPKSVSPVPLITIEIRDVAERQLVTAIEVLSPTNKRGDGYREYLEKRGRILSSTAHLIEIDLLRRGKRVPMQSPLPPAPYYIFVGRTEKRPIVEVWPIQLTERLPVIPIPLLAGDADVPCDLQQALERVYDGFRYDLTVDYRRPPEVPLSKEALAWANERLREAGLRKQN